jgi:serralysin
VSGEIDTLTDYEAGHDRIELAAGQFGDLLGGPLAESALHVGGQGLVMTQDTRIVYEPSTGALFFDADGSGAQAAMQFALVSNAPPSLRVDDFTIGTA